MADSPKKATASARTVLRLTSMLVVLLVTVLTWSSNIRYWLVAPISSQNAVVSSLVISHLSKVPDPVVVSTFTTSSYSVPSDGEADGDALTVEEGEAEGEPDLVADGLSDTVALGESDAVALGVPSDGLVLGVALGLSDAVADGDADTVWLGEADGESGLADGVALGESEGDP